MKTLALALILVLSAACASIPVVDPCRDPEPYPVGFWDPPQNIAELDAEPEYLTPGVKTPENEAETEAAVEAVVSDFLTAKADAGSCRAKYSALVVRIMTEVPPD